MREVWPGWSAWQPEPAVGGSGGRRQGRPANRARAPRDPSGFAARPRPWTQRHLASGPGSRRSGHEPREQSMPGSPLALPPAVMG